MLVSQDQLCPSYKNAIQNLDQHLDECDGDVEKRQQIMLQFSSNYLMTIPYWQEVIGQARGREDNSMMNYLITKAHEHLHVFYLAPKDERTPMLKLLMFMFSGQYEDPDVEYDEGDLCYPHPHLSGCLYKLETESDKPLPKELLKIYESNIKLYEKIKAAENNVEEWFRLITQFGEESGNDQFVKLMIECRLGRNLLDTKLWQLYIEYLREENPHEMLQLYSKYCRFYVDDLEMKEKYKKEEEEYGPVFVDWENRFEFETLLPADDEMDVEEEEEEDGEMFFEVNLGDGVYRVRRKDFVPNHPGGGIWVRPNCLKKIRDANGDRLDEIVLDASDEGHVLPDFEGDELMDSENDNLPAADDENVNPQSLDTENKNPSSLGPANDDPFADPEAANPPLYFENGARLPPKLLQFLDEEINKAPISPEILQLSGHFYARLQSLQSFPFKAPFVRYIIDSANPSILKKLHHCCKYFFTRKPTPICYKLETYFHTEFSEDSLKITPYKADTEKEKWGYSGTELSKNFWITNSFITDHLYKNGVHQILSNIYRCDAKYIELQCDLSSAELKILLESGNVVVFKWHEASRSEDSSAPKMEDITQYLPKIEELTITPVTITPKTIKTLLKQNFVSKLFSLHLCFIQGEPFDIDGFLKFCINNRAAIFNMMITFHSSFGNQPFLTEFKERMMQYESVTEMTKFSDIFHSIPF